MNPTDLECEILEWFSRRRSVRWANIPQHWKPTIRRHVHDQDREGVLRWLERHNVHEVRITSVGRMLAAAYRHGRASAPASSVAVGQ